MTSTMLVSSIIFVGTLTVIFSEKMQRTIVAVVGAIVMVGAGTILGFYSEEQAIEAVDFHTLGLLLGMMVLVALLEPTGFFEYLAIWAARLSKGQPVRLMVLLGTVTTALSMFLDNVTNVPELYTGFYHFNAQVHTFKADFAQPAGAYRWLADVEHTTGVAVKPVLDYGDVDINDIALFQGLVARNAMADDMVDGSANGFREAPVIQGCRYGVLPVNNVAMADFIQFTRGNSGLHVVADHIQHFRRKAACDAHFFYFFGVFDCDGH